MKKYQFYATPGTHVCFQIFVSFLEVYLNHSRNLYVEMKKRRDERERQRDKDQDARDRKQKKKKERYGKREARATSKKDVRKKTERTKYEGRSTLLCVCVSACAEVRSRSCRRSVSRCCLCIASETCVHENSAYDYWHKTFRLAIYDVAMLGLCGRLSFLPQEYFIAEQKILARARQVSLPTTGREETCPNP